MMGNDPVFLGSMWIEKKRSQRENRMMKLPGATLPGFLEIFSPTLGMNSRAFLRALHFRESSREILPSLRARPVTTSREKTDDFPCQRLFEMLQRGDSSAQGSRKDLVWRITNSLDRLELL